MSVTIVSVYYSIPSKNSHKTYDKYINLFLNNTNANIILFTSLNMVEYFNKFKRDNLYIIYQELDDNEIFIKYRDLWEHQYLIDNQKYTGRTIYNYIIWNSKLLYIKKAIELNIYNSDKYIWLDIGCIRDNACLEKLNIFPIYENISSNKIDIVMIKEIDNDEILSQDEIHLGGLFGGSGKMLLIFYELFYSNLDKYITNNKFIGCDQQTIARVYLDNKIIFNIICPYSDNYTENNKCIKYTDFIDPWFYIINFYS